MRRELGSATRTRRGVLDAAAHPGGTPDANVEVIVVGQGPSRLLQQLRGADAQARRGAHALGVREQTCAKRGGDEDVGHVRLRIAHQRRDQGPVLRVVEPRPRPSEGGAVAAEGDEMRRRELLPGRAADEEREVRVPAALVRAMPLDLASAFVGQISHRRDRLGELAPDLARGAVDQLHERLQSPPRARAFVGRNHAQVARLLDVRAAEQMALGGRTDASPEAERRWPQRAGARHGAVLGRRPGDGSRRERESRREGHRGD